jgi:hypothetical protein
MRASPLVVLALSLAAACGSESSTFQDGSSSGSSGGTSSSSSGGFGGDGGASSSGSSGNGSPEVCDGIDNDGNGVIDDVDKGGDGICDCLRIATLGVPGKWGSGNVFSAWLNARSDLGATSLGDKVLTKQLLDGFEVIVAQDLSTMTRAYAPEEVTALSDWVKAGGGFMTLIGYAGTSELANVNKLLAAFGMSYTAQAILPKQGGSTVPVTGWDPHPVTSGVLKVGVDNGYPVAGTGTVIGREGGFDLLKVQEVGPGHVLTWGDEWITYDSEWSGHPDYQVERFWLNAIKWLTPAKQCQVALPPVK